MMITMLGQVGADDARMIYFHCTVCVVESGGLLEVLVVDMGLDLRKQFIWGRLKNVSFGLSSLGGSRHTFSYFKKMFSFV